MKRLLFLFCWLSLLPAMLTAEKIQRVIFNYSIDNFRIQYQDSMVDVTGLLAHSDNLPYDPAIPYMAYNIPVPKGMRCIRYNVEVPDTLLLSTDKVLATNRGPICFDHKHTHTSASWSGMKPYNGLKGVYPSESFICDDEGFTFYPFEYNADIKELVFTPTIIIDRILVSENENSGNSLSNISSSGNDIDELVELILYQGNLSMELRGFRLDSNYDIVDPTYEDPIDYIIITNKSLEKYFKDLLEWKTIKGLRCRIKTIEDIDAEYKNQGKTSQERIKTYIYDMYKNHGVSYILLGGNIPLVYAKVEKSSLLPEEGLIPTDLYYGCFDGQFDWDANKNGIFGELTDNISLVPNIIVSRLPVTRSDDAVNAINKIIEYEKSGKINKTIFMEGSLIENTVKVNEERDEEISDGQYYSEGIYTQYIKPYWDGTLTTQYSNQNMGKEIGLALNRGEGFIDVQSHGEFDKWIFGDNDTYTTDDAKTNINPYYSIITTNACDTNAFDGRDSFKWKNPLEGWMYPSLSQVLISQPRNGVVAFLGSSRTGWGFKDRLGPSQDYIGVFYQSLFLDQTQPKNFGKLISQTKRTLERLTRSNQLYRWLQFSINPIGDPEMPIYTIPGQLFNHAKVNMGKNYIIVDAGEDNCVICLTGEINGIPYQKVFRNQKTVIFNEIPENAVVCITKQNYKPFIKKLEDTNSQSLELQPIGRIIALRNNTSYLDVELDIPGNASDAIILLTDIIHNSTILKHVSLEEKAIRIDSELLVKGFYILNLYVDETLHDSKKVEIR